MNDDTRPTGDELVLAIVGAAAVLLVLPLALVVGTFSLWMAPTVAVAAMLVFSRRDSSHGLAALGAVAVVWLAAAPSGVSAWDVAVALLMLVVHATLALRTTVPPGAALGRVVVVRWVRRCAIVALLTVAVYLLALVTQGLHQSDTEVVLAAALALLGGLILVLRSESLDGSGGAPLDPPRPGGERPTLEPRSSRGP